MSYEPSLFQDNNPMPPLQNQLAELSGEISAAQAEDAKYTGGLLKSLIAVRLQILLITKALIEQRIQSIESGAPITVVVNTTAVDENRAGQLEQELERQSLVLKQARAEAALYTGGLIASLKASTVATQENSLAMLRQQFLIAKYGLALPTHTTNPVTSNTSTATPPDPPKPPTVKPPETPRQLFDIVSVDTRVTETNRTWSKYAWKLIVRSFAAAPLQLEAKIEFQDRDGFVVDDHTEYRLILRAHEQETYAGYKLINAPVAQNVARVSAKVKVM